MTSIKEIMEFSKSINTKGESNSGERPDTASVPEKPKEREPKPRRRGKKRR